MNRVVITGYGGICSLGEDAVKIWESVLNKSMGYDNYNDRNIRANFFGRIKNR
ncbi:3-oxoacyl-[acyl-carrier-protein] synthase II [Izhakiella capsodis]|uniref:3-oxoacyl-[acyl-carrier-protein] synthase II n=1 Tax=Izhakiella capsodis TaxID=1367852 RepID=A0A1I5ADC6_9GAMM|nr:hypothetical protein [Izhakiella capsodis]SFN60219.1 3-oxoacyl-[acyl-carrier-protein] synthase II [Izhakiella capsodis]